MTVLHIFTIHDSKAQAHLAPFTLPTAAMAERTFRGTVNDTKHTFCENAEDYTLFHHGEFNVLTGEFKINKAMKSLGNGVDYKAPPES